MTWQHGILKTLSSWGLQGHILHFIRNFLKNRTFTVKANGFSSGERMLENGCPQGSVLSPTLFLVALNSLHQQIAFPSLSTVYADDLVVFATGKNLVTLEEELQDTLHKLEAWSHDTGFHFSTLKTKYIVFSKKKYYLHSNPNSIQSSHRKSTIYSFSGSHFRLSTHMEISRHFDNLLLQQTN
ncbi:RVT 1 domain containing protein [Asbolus verrucosus]|uniref:RVT 1 domain containing protein n=1 Tax=Asbolus verrucosus TaxID=1661398 RepID=A0A482VC77_ASBVE|nr:RVT 1 domain containing protein [Asbolus verrucosus]